MRYTAIWLAIGVVTAGPASASDKQDFVTCDGRMQPGKQDDGMRGEASRMPFGDFRPGQAQVIAACTTALASPRLLPTQTLRRLHLLRARAAAYLGAESTDPAGLAKAMADLDQIEAAAGDLGRDRFYQRSMAVSIKLLRAIAYAKSNDFAHAVPLARESIAARPYSLQVQTAGATILQAGRPVGTTSPSPWTPVTRLDPQAGVGALIREADVGNFAAVLALEPSVPRPWPTEPLKPLDLMTRSAPFSQTLGSMIAGLHVAYARAATGDGKGARRDLADIRAKLAATLDPKPQAAAASGGKATEQLAALTEGASRETARQLNFYVDARARQIEARSAVTEGNPTAAIAALVAAPLPRDAATLDLLNALKAAVPAKDAALVPDAAPFRDELAKSRTVALGEVIPAVMIAPETPRAVVDYDRSRPNILGALVGGALSMGTSLLGGINRTDGFRSTANTDGTAKVEFIGNTPSAALVQEMTLLRAAEVTRSAGKPAFVVEKRSDYTRRLTTTQYGREISSVPTGFKTELTIRFLDRADQNPRAIDALTIIDALGPFYYEQGAPQAGAGKTS